MRVTFLGTSGAVPTTERNPSALMVNREGERLLFDAAEGTQRQMMRFGTGFAVSHLFVTHLHGDHVLGIPGLVQTWDFNGRDDPLMIHTPTGTRREIRNLVEATGAHPSYPVHINEVEPDEVAYAGEDYEVRTFETDHRTTSVGYALVEEDRKGRFNREKAEALGVPVGPLFQELHAGNPVELEDGTVVEPEQVVGKPRPGRRFVYTGDTRPSPEVIEAATDADLLIHDATFDDERAGRARETGHSTGTEAGEVAKKAGVKRLALTHISSRYAGNAGLIHSDAVAAFDGDVFVPHDGQTVDVPYPDD
ncbi:ribonuclease Z [Haladaptatus sp. ZSTT2]|uniref:ribonuclease Z n=1 Tax=Haladaptatus sp. ZSTT2 TaxID=3120515 RepID=UPI00300EE4F1